MDSQVFRFALLASSLFVSACATTAPSPVAAQPSGAPVDQPPGFMLASLGEATAPPAGLLAFCLANPGFCDQALPRPLTAPAARGPSPTAIATGFTPGGRVDGGALFQAMMRSRIATMAPAPAEQPQLDGGALFQALLRQGAGVRAAGQVAGRASPDRAETEWTPALSALLRRINADVNWRIEAMEDIYIYGVNEQWAMPLSQADRRIGARGDCEDFALEKRARLMDAGVPARAIALVTAYAPDVGMHAMVMVRTDRGDILLDNLSDRPMPVAETAYTFLSMQQGETPGVWTRVALAVRPEPSQASLAAAERTALESETVAARPAEPAFVHEGPERADALAGGVARGRRTLLQALPVRLSAATDDRIASAANLPPVSGPARPQGYALSGRVRGTFSGRLAGSEHEASGESASAPAMADASGSDAVTNPGRVRLAASGWLVEGQDWSLAAQIEALSAGPVAVFESPVDPAETASGLRGVHVADADIAGVEGATPQPAGEGAAPGAPLAGLESVDTGTADG